MARKLKVYRTPIGFHDAYVAATSQKEALKAWGAEADLFARGVAELVSDEALTEEPLQAPGTVVRRPRGTNDDYLAALPEDRPAAERRSAPSEKEEPPPRRRRRSGTTAGKSVRPPSRSRPQTVQKAASTPKPASKRALPRPSRAKLDEAERAIETAEADHAQKIAAIREKEKRLQEERRALEKSHEADIAHLDAALTRARDRYAAALEKWRK